MRKHAFIFLSLFSLILMLSVYYVTLPSDTIVSEVSNQSKKVAKVEQRLDDKKVQSQIEHKLQEKHNEQSSVVASSESSDDDKKQALETMDQVKQISKEQEDIRSLLKKQGYKTSVEIKNHTCKVCVFGVKESKDIAEKVLMSVTSLIKDKYLVEVTFK